MLEQGKLSLHDQITKYIKKDIWNNLHHYKKTDYSEKITVKNLLFQTSGLPDISEEGVKILRNHLPYEDMKVEFEEIIRMTKQQKPHFAPTTEKRAHYSDVNFDLLGKIIETVTQSTLYDAYKRFIFNPLEFKATYLPEIESDFIPSIYHKDDRLYRPQFIKSCKASGGCVSTARELMVFIKAFFSGRLFHRSIFNEYKEVNRLQVSMFPIQYSAGYMFIPLSGIANLFMGKGELMGHSGSTGSFAFYYPRQDLFFVGDINQSANPALPVRLAMQLAIRMK